MDLRYQAEKLLGKNRRASTLTQYKNTGQIRRLCDLIQSKYGLESIKNLKTKHVQGVFSDLRGQGLSASTLASYATAARTIAHTIGKDNIVPRANSDLGITRAGERLRPISADTKMLGDITELLYARAEWLGLAADMRRQFGLRAKESLLTHETRDGRLVVRGTKGGRPREIPLRNDSQRTLLERVQEHIKKEGKSSLVPSEMSLKQGLKFQSNVLFRLGATKENKAHAHSARHEYAQQLSRSGASKKVISEELGHGRAEVVSHYVPK